MSAEPKLVNGELQYDLKTAKCYACDAPATHVAPSFHYEEQGIKILDARYGCDRHAVTETFYYQDGLNALRIPYGFKLYYNKMHGSVLLAATNVKVPDGWHHIPLATDGSGLFANTSNKVQ